jgi:nucleoside phosphorylase
LTRGDKITANPQLLSRVTAAAYLWSKNHNEIQPSPELILSGEKLVDNLDFRDELTTLFPGAKGGEMEASGIYSAARENETRWIIIKAVCDYADGNKNKDKEINQKLAASKAASFVFYLLKNNYIT